MTKSKDRRIKVLVQTLDDISRYCDAVAELEITEKAERRTWKAVARMARAAIRRREPLRQGQR